ncbi:MAG: hypothetical protein Q9M91_06335 [Candidatus Dojkabacteria bacterium]|nr:hypothetical protein [Candidatus Dojkabacteria bacterium]MDQ7021414.1 hypothetical protein [Candidatus Dojkabacteria bacterium]
MANNAVTEDTVDTKNNKKDSEVISLDDICTNEVIDRFEGIKDIVEVTDRIGDELDLTQDQRLGNVYLVTDTEERRYVMVAPAAKWRRLVMKEEETGRVTSVNSRNVDDPHIMVSELQILALSPLSSPEFRRIIYDLESINEDFNCWEAKILENEKRRNSMTSADQLNKAEEGYLGIGIEVEISIEYAMREMQRKLDGLREDVMLVDPSQMSTGDPLYREKLELFLNTIQDGVQELSKAQRELSSPGPVASISQLTDAYMQIMLKIRNEAHTGDLINVSSVHQSGMDLDNPINTTLNASDSSFGSYVENVAGNLFKYFIDPFLEDMPDQVRDAWEQIIGEENELGKYVEQYTDMRFWIMNSFHTSHSMTTSKEEGYVSDSAARNIARITALFAPMLDALNYSSNSMFGKTVRIEGEAVHDVRALARNIIPSSMYGPVLAADTSLLTQMVKHVLTGVTNVADRGFVETVTRGGETLPQQHGFLRGRFTIGIDKAFGENYNKSTPSNRIGNIARVERTGGSATPYEIPYRDGTAIFDLLKQAGLKADEEGNDVIAWVIDRVSDFEEKFGNLNLDPNTDEFFEEMVKTLRGEFNIGKLELLEEIIDVVELEMIERVSRQGLSNDQKNRLVEIAASYGLDLPFEFTEEFIGRRYENNQYKQIFLIAGREWLDPSLRGTITASREGIQIYYNTIDLMLEYQQLLQKEPENRPNGILKFRRMLERPVSWGAFIYTLDEADIRQILFYLEVDVSMTDSIETLKQKLTYSFWFNRVGHYEADVEEVEIQKTQVVSIEG